MNCKLGDNNINCNIYMLDVNWLNAFQPGNPGRLNFSFSNAFNGNVTLPRDFEGTNGLFASCPNFNGYVTMPITMKNCSNMFAYSNNYNQPTVIPMAVENCYEMLYECANFNAPVVTSPSCNDYRLMFSNCQNYSQDIVVNGNNADCSQMFYNCISLDARVAITNGIVKCTSMFYNCCNFNKPVTIPNSVNIGINVSSMLAGCHNFNSPIEFKCLDMQPSIDASTTSSFLQNCFSFNQPITIPKNFTLRENYPWDYYYNFAINEEFGFSQSGQVLFSRCRELSSDITILDNQAPMANLLADAMLRNNSSDESHFNGNVVIGNYVPTIARLLYGQKYFNASVTLGENILDMEEAFLNCVSFDKPVVIGDGALKSKTMFRNCKSLDSIVTIPDSVIDCQWMFQGCTNLTQPIKIPEKAKYIYGMFKNCRSFNQPLFVPDSVVSSYQYEGLISDCISYKSSISVPSLPMINIGINDEFLVHHFNYVSSMSTINYQLGMTIIARDDAFVDVIGKYKITPPPGSLDPIRIVIATQEELEFYGKGCTIEPIGDEVQPYLENEPPHYNTPNYNVPESLSGINNCSYYYKGCTDYNQPTTVPNTAYKADGMFANCRNLNQPITFEE